MEGEGYVCSINEGDRAQWERERNRRGKGRERERMIERGGREGVRGIGQ